MEKETYLVDADVNTTAQPVVEKKIGYNGDYTGFFYKQIERLWDAIYELQQENNDLQTALALVKQ